MTARGRPTVEAWEQARVTELEAFQVTARCAFCSWSLQGDVRAAREAHEAHRTAEHPEIQPKPRRKRFKHQFSSHRNLDDNIANAREQGAATWAGPV